MKVLEDEPRLMGHQREEKGGRERFFDNRGEGGSPLLGLGSYSAKKGGRFEWREGRRERGGG